MNTVKGIAVVAAMFMIASAPALAARQYDPHLGQGALANPNARPLGLKQLSNGRWVDDGYTQFTAPDEASRSVLSHSINPFAEVADGSHIGEGQTQALDESAQVQEQNFAHLHAADAREMIDRLSDIELNNIAALYLASLQRNPQHAARLMDVLASRLDAKRLGRVKLAFATQQLLTSSGANHFVSAEWYFYTPEEIYLDLRTAPVGSLGVGASLIEMGAFCATSLYLSYHAGQAIGTYIYPILEKYDPQLIDDIGGTIDQIMQDIEDQGSSTKNIGQYQQTLWDDSTWSSYGVTSNWAGIVEQNGGDYTVDHPYNWDWSTDFGGGGGTCWPFSCELF